MKYMIVKLLTATPIIPAMFQAWSMLFYLAIGNSKIYHIGYNSDKNY